MLKIIMRNLVLTILVVLLVILLIWLVIHRNKKNNLSNIAAPVEVTKVIRKDAPYIIELAGNAETYQTADIKSQVTGQILSVNFDDGQEVKADDLLYEIDPRPFQNQLQQAEASLLSDTYNLENAIKEEARYRNLYKENAVSEEQYLQMLTNMNVLKAAVERDKAVIADANLQIEYSKIVAPFDGKLSESNVDIGNLAQAGLTTLVTINTISPIYVSFPVPEEHLNKINKSQKNSDLSLIVKTSNGQEVTDGEIVFIDNTIDSNSGTIKLKATLPNKDEILCPGQFVRVSLSVYTEKDALVVPSKAIQTNDQGPYVFIVDKNNKAVIKNVEIAFSNDDFVVIKSGVEEGEIVVTNGQLRLNNNTEVVIKESD
ncbi:efflux RND transporter periplasmic adaptor subunit [Rickettsia endosymbiont of Lasioglossum villosulum]|uniref:efflux RND transporter periplasmic adaptor subunit n=1 Tax=Rickettsia endosymbiont of Lasioglossum villosulum TaxID=3066269 RepID=UPI003132E69A